MEHHLPGTFCKTLAWRPIAPTLSPLVHGAAEVTDQSQTLPLAADFPPATRDQWLALVEKVLARESGGAARLVSRTPEGIAIEALYTRADRSEGRQAQAPRARLSGEDAWDICQIHAEPDPALANAAILEDLEGGATSVLLQLAAPGAWGLGNRRDVLARALAGVRLDACGIALKPGAGYAEAAESLLQLWREQEVSGPARRGQLNADPLGTLAATGSLPAPLEASMQAAARLAVACAEWPKVTALVADGHVYHAAGAGEAQELAIVAATIVAYLRVMEGTGLAPDRALPKIAVNLAVDADQFLSIAKLRAARRLIARIAEACGAEGTAGGALLSAETAWRMMARRDPWVNMLRTTIACASAVMGGADAITVLPFSWALGRPDSFARRITRNTHLVLREESRLGRVADPAAGSWYVETLSDELAGKAWELFQAIEARGGMGAALTSGFVQDEIGRVALRRADRIARGEEEITGVSSYPLLGSDGVRAEPWPDPIPVTGPQLARALAPRRSAEPFEALRDAADRQAVRTGAPPRVFLARLGRVGDFAQRATWTQNFLAAGGIEAVVSDSLDTAEAAAAAFAASGLRVACLCSSDAVYASLAEAAARALRSAGASQVYVAGRPREQEQALRAAGASGFWFAGEDRIALLRTLQRELGVEG
jgi:methylmalonyl-CoA mutase